MSEGTSNHFVNEVRVDDDRSLGSIISEIKVEFKEFVNTRVRVIKAELHETIGAARTAVPLIITALVLGFISIVLFSLAIVALLASAFPGSPYAWFYGLVIVGVLWIGGAAVAAFFAMNALRANRFPKRSVEVLKADKIWLQTEARSHS
ncbi:MAG TPA: phage holin family protein [Terriglobales bacterium]|jgi:uncharacterized membrane protein YqjE